MRGFAHVHEKARQIIGLGIDWKLWVLCDREPIQKWTDGRVVLLGDAAHPMLQYMAQGACMAMEDAVCLSYMVESYPGDLPKAFDAYRQRRINRTTRVQLQSRAMGEHVFHPAGAHAELRNAVMRAKSQLSGSILCSGFTAAPDLMQRTSADDMAASFRLQS